MSNQTKEFYLTIEKSSVAEFKDRGSKFIAFAYSIISVNEFKEKLAETKKLHPKASHFCFAYRIGINADNFRVSDAGEPSGSAGKPILNAIDSKDLTNVLVIVVRYFGGTLLGVPGLINAYKTSSSLVLQTTPKIKKPVLVYYELEFDYTQTNHVMQIIKKLEATILENKTQLFCKIKIALLKSMDKEFFDHISKIHQVFSKKL